MGELNIGAGHRLIILGSMDEFCELVRRAREYGIYTIVVDGYEDGPAKRLADRSYTIDPRDTGAIVRLCVEERADAVFGTFSDLLAECMVNISAAAGLPCYATPERFLPLRQKPHMKKMFRTLGIASAPSCVLHPGFDDAELGAVGFPCVVKPSNGYGSRGVYIASDASFIRTRFDEISSYSTGTDCIVAERYNGGYEMNMMCWIVDGHAVVLSIADREKTRLNDYDIPFVSRIVYPSVFTESLASEARGIVQRIADYTGIVNGPVCMQFFYTPGKGIEVCEVAGRIFGYEHELLALAGGPEVEEVILAHLFDHTSLRAMLAHHDCRLPRVSSGLYFHGWAGRTVADLSPARSAATAPNVVEFLPYYEPGDTVSHGVGAKPYVLRYYLASSHRAQIDASSRVLFDSVKVLDVDGENLLYRNELTRYPSSSV